MFLVNQKHPYWCVHACLESVCFDRGLGWTQDAIETHFHPYFPPPVKVFQALLIPSVTFAIGIANFYAIGKGFEFLHSYNGRLSKDNGFILVVTQREANGGEWGHCLRVAEIKDDSFLVLDPSGEGEMKSLPSSFLDECDCLIYFCAMINGAPGK